ncbi:MAG: alpha/beta fold hydrolase [Pusillimonas sp.]
MSVLYYKEFAVRLSGLLPEERLPALKQYLSEIQDAELRSQAARYLVSFQAGVDDTPETVFVLLHGIRTAGAWQDRLAQLLKVERQLIALPVKYGVFGVLRFLIPPLRGRAYALTQRHLSNVREVYPQAKIVVVAHSFGTYIVTRLLAEKRCLVDRLLLCGSVVPHEFDWKTAFPAATRSNVINDVGTKDVWPIIAHATSYGCGASGFLGFGNPCVTDRFHPLRHSDFFTDSHIEEYWLPFLLEGRVAPSKHTEERSEISWFSGLICSLPNAFVTLGVVAIVAYWAVL